uniref:Uncharacterized protein n=1 Tax=Anguilla anguilla TaxID=7936 RepID=A0A0E9XML4_ANGAN
MVSELPFCNLFRSHPFFISVTVSSERYEGTLGLSGGLE